jgi:hypothetical protein
LTPNKLEAGLSAYANGAPFVIDFAVDRWRTSCFDQRAPLSVQAVEQVVITPRSHLMQD